nr:aminoacyl-tRNA hydrolase [uncultured Desulfobulbus sp.]
MADTRFLLVGLGNPGAEYELTRHNVGFIFLDYLAERAGCRIDGQKMDGLYGQARAFGNQLLYLKPQTYMNRSGKSVRAFADYFKIPKERIMVLHDDLDLATGRIKVVGKGGAGGHNGIRSLGQHLGCSDFARIKIGIGRPPQNEQGQGQPVDRYVLSKMGTDEIRLFEQRFDIVEEAVELFVRDGIDRCMNSINGRNQT